MRKNFTSEQMLYTVRQAESGTPVAEVLPQGWEETDVLIAGDDAHN